MPSPTCGPELLLIVFKIKKSFDFSKWMLNWLQTLQGDKDSCALEKMCSSKGVMGICDSQSRRSLSYCCSSDCAGEEAAALTAMVFSGDLKDN